MQVVFNYIHINLPWVGFEALFLTDKLHYADLNHAIKKTPAYPTKQAVYKTCLKDTRGFRVVVTLLVVLLLVLLVVGCVHVEFVGKSCPVRLFGIGIHVCGGFLMVIHTY